jgi:hypothetical protein
MKDKGADVQVQVEKVAVGRLARCHFMDIWLC